MRILVAAEISAIAQSLCTMLAPHHYAIDIALDGQLAWRFIDTYDYDLLIIGEVLPQLDGISLCRRVRSSDRQMPILLIAHHSDGHQKSIGLDAGADDYMVQPINPEELVARVRALLRRHHVTNSPVLTWGDLRLESSTRTVTCNNHLLALTPKEYSLLEMFLHDRQRVFSYGAIIEHLWVGDENPSEDTVRTHMKGLRHKLKAAGIKIDPIETVYGVGYRLRQAEFPTAPHPLAISQQRSWQLLIAEPDLVAAQEVAAVALRLGIQVQVANTIRSLRASIALYRPRVLLVELAIAENLAGARQLLAEISQITPPLVIVIWSRYTDIAARLMASQSAACRFIPKPSSAQYVIEVVQAVAAWRERADTQSPSEPENQILVVYKDTPALMALHQALEPINFQLTTLKQPQRLWTTLATINPQLVIIELDLGQYHGLEICRMLRQDACWCKLPITILTDRHDPQTIQKIFGAGADNFLIQPITEPELVTYHIQRLLERHHQY